MTITATGVVHLLLVLVILGVAWWLAENYLPMPAPMKLIIRVIIVIAIILFLLNFIGLV